MLVLTANIGGSVTVNVLVSLHPLMFVYMTVYVPSPRFDKGFVVEPVLQE